MMDSCSLLELQRQLSEGLGELFPDKLWVRAEIAQLQARSNGHCYMDLVESSGGEILAKARAVIWRGRYGIISKAFFDTVGGPLQAGMNVLALVEVNYSELYGLTLVVDDIEPQFTLGESELRKRKTLEKLEKEGFMEMQAALTLVPLPYNLAVISARDAAGFGDFKRHLEENEYGFRFNVNLFEAVMQGQNAPASISDALDVIESSPVQYDAVLVMRGGGSALDLSCFDDYDLCARMAACGIPVFTAIGHDRDCHIADMLAYRSVKTPTALADEFIGAFAAEDERIDNFSIRLRMAFLSRIAEMENRVELLASRISAADPRNILKRGYTLTANQAGIVIKSSKNVGIGEKITILYEDGELVAEVISKK